MRYFMKNIIILTILNTTINTAFYVPLAPHIPNSLPFTTVKISLLLAIKGPPTLATRFPTAVAAADA